MKKYLLNQEKLDILVKDFLDNFKSGVVVLQGDLASGKTTLVKHFAKYLGIDDDVTSPTFSLQQIYGDKIYHYDIYNKGLDSFISLGLIEELEKNGLHFIEWGDDKLEEMLKSYGFNVAKIKILKQEDKREYKVSYA